MVNDNDNDNDDETARRARELMPISNGLIKHFADTVIENACSPDDAVVLLEGLILHSIAFIVVNSTEGDNDPIGTAMTLAYDIGNVVNHELPLVVARAAEQPETWQ